MNYIKSGILYIVLSAHPVRPWWRQLLVIDSTGSAPFATPTRFACWTREKPPSLERIRSWWKTMLAFSAASCRNKRLPRNIKLEGVVRPDDIYSAISIYWRGLVGDRFSTTTSYFLIQLWWYSLVKTNIVLSNWWWSTRTREEWLGDNEEDARGAFGGQSDMWRSGSRFCMETKGSPTLVRSGKVWPVRNK